MKTKLFLGICLSVIILFQSAAQPSLQWAKRFNGPVADDNGKAITLDASGNIYITGSSDGVGVASDYLTIKYNPNGDTIWTRRYNGSANGGDEAVAIKVDGAGNVYIIGKSQGTGTGYDIVTIKYNSSGIQQWVAVFNGSTNGDDLGYNLIVDVNGNVYVIGGRPFNDGVVIKYNAFGILQWSKVNIETAYLIAINSFNNIVVAVDDPGAFGNYVILELNPSNGSVLYQYNTPFIQTFQGTPNAMALDGAGNMYVTSTEFNSVNAPTEVNTAKFTHTIHTATWISKRTGGGTISGIDIKIDGNLNSYVLSSFYNGNNYNYFIEKYNPSGVSQWTKQYNASAGIDDIPVSLSLNDLINPEIFITGYTSTGNITTVGYDNNGNQLWDPVVYDCGNNGTDNASAMIMSPNCNNIFITGSSNCNGTNRDVKTIKYSTSVPPAITPGGATICEDGNVTLSVDACMGCTYLWSAGQTTQSIIVTPATTTNYTVTVTDTNGCGAASLPVTVTVNPTLTPSVSIVTPETSICSGQNATFTATPINGGTSPSFEWFVDNNSVGMGSSFSTTALTNGAQVYCTMTSNALCVNPSIATSNALIITVNPQSVPSVSVLASSTTICSGENVTFTATPTNGGTTPSYDWYLNGVKVGSNNPIYSTSALTNGSQVYCSMTSEAVCANPAIVTSGTFTITVNPILVPSVNVTASSTSICSGENATFTANPINGGALPTYQWYVNDTQVGNNSQTYSTTTLTNGSEVYCTMTSNAICVNPTMANSNSLAITVNQPLVPSVSITALDPCTFTASPTNGGTSPFYQWYVDNVPIVGVNNQTYSNTTLENGSEIYCVMTSNAACANPAIAISNIVIIEGCIIIVTKEYKNIIQIAAFPNPTSNFFTIEGKGLNSGLYRINLNNIFGQPLIEKSIWISGQELAIQLKIEGFPSGNYYVIIYSDMHTYTIPVQKW